MFASKVKGGLENSLKGLGVDVLEAHGEVVAPQTLKAGDRTIKARDIILAPGSVPFVPPGIETDGKTVFTPVGTLLGPIKTSFGYHLIRVTERSDE